MMTPTPSSLRRLSPTINQAINKSITAPKMRFLYPLAAAAVRGDAAGPAHGRGADAEAAS